MTELQRAWQDLESAKRALRRSWREGDGKAVAMAQHRVNAASVPVRHQAVEAGGRSWTCGSSMTARC